MLILARDQSDAECQATVEALREMRTWAYSCLGPCPLLRPAGLQLTVRSMLLAPRGALGSSSLLSSSSLRLAGESAHAL